MPISRVCIVFMAGLHEYTNSLPPYSATSLLETLLQFDPELRVSAADALTSPYLAPYHDPSDEPEATEVFEESFQEADLSADLWKTITYVFNGCLSGGVLIVV